MLRPELQSIDDFAEGIANIAEAQAKAARDYFEDGSADEAIPPLRAILHVMAEGIRRQERTRPRNRGLFDRDHVFGSDWYKERLERYRDNEIDYVSVSLERLRRYLADSAEAGSVAARRARSELARTEERMSALSEPGYLDLIKGSIGLDPLFRGPASGAGDSARATRAE